MSDTVKLGPLWNRTTVSPSARVIKRMGRTLCRFEELKQLRLTEYIAPFEEEQLLNAHPEVEKAARAAELWADLKDGRALLVFTLDQGGLLLSLASQVSTATGAPLVTERKHLETAAA
ncbi:MAG: hypothetical protein ACT4TC_00770 [Myxococcaceae bacterium]